MKGFTNLFKSRQIPLSTLRKQVMDDRKYESNKYRDNMLKNSLSPYISRNPVMNDFVVLLQQVMADLVDSVRLLKGYKSYTTKKDDSNIK
jgi:hypothetical protein